jgi:NAD(P)-dependent dehydrogenase (short-subunit alcohol dehydrogenase family)
MGGRKVWLVTGAGRGMGVDIARAALAAGHAVVATGRNTEKVSSAITAWKSMNGQQSGDPAKLANALIQLAAQDEPPLRFPGGADAVTTFENRAKLLQAQADANRELSSNLDHDDA